MRNLCRRAPLPGGDGTITRKILFFFAFLASLRDQLPILGLTLVTEGRAPIFSDPRGRGVLRRALRVSGVVDGGGPRSGPDRASRP